MSFTLSQAAYTSIGQMFDALKGVLDKGAAYAKAREMDEAVLINWRLAPDMFPLSRQVQIATDIAGRGLARLSGAELPSNPDAETTFEALRGRVIKAEAFIAGLDRAKIDIDPEGSVTFPLGPETMTMKRSDYLLLFVLPNVYFHVTTTYAILRACGASLGKMDFLPRLG